MLARVLYGARVSLAVGLLSAAVAGASGTAIGGIAGYAGGSLDNILMRATDAMLAVPRLPLLMIAAAVFQPSVPQLVLLIGLASWMETARVARAELLSLRTRDFVGAARALGAGHARLILAHLLPMRLRRHRVRRLRSAGRSCRVSDQLLRCRVQPRRRAWQHAGQAPALGDPWLRPGLFIFATALSVNSAAKVATAAHQDP